MVEFGMSKTPVYEITWQLVRAPGFSSAAIGFDGMGYYSHIDVVTPSGFLRGARSDTVRAGKWKIPPGYRDRPQGYTKWIRATRFTIEVTPIQYEKYWTFSERQLGKPYACRNLFETFILGWRYGVKPHWSKKTWRDEAAWWCSDEVGANMEAAGIVEVPPILRGITPGSCGFMFTGLNARRREIIQATA
jgi:hypothetical protein